MRLHFKFFSGTWGMTVASALSAAHKSLDHPPRQHNARDPAGHGSSAGCGPPGFKFNFLTEFLITAGDTS